MKKAYLVGHSYDVCNDNIDVGIFLDKDKADAYVKEHNIPREEAEKRHKMCQKCRKYEDYSNQKNNTFILSEKCSLAKIGTDRNGTYCENDRSDYYSAMGGTDYYYVEELNLLDLNKEDLKMETGTIKWYNPKNGYGFITKDKGGDIFFHITAVRVNPSKRIDTGRGVSFTVENNEKGEVAKAVELTGCNLKELRKMWKERDCSIKIGRNPSGYIGYKIVDDEDGSIVLGVNFELSLTDIECYYYA